MTYKVNAGGLFKSCVASYVSEALGKNLHSDLSIQTSPDDAPIMCHRLVLASALPLFRRTLTAVDQDAAVTQVFIPGLEQKEIRSLVQFIYASALPPKNPSAASPKLTVSSTLYRAFNMQEIDGKVLEALEDADCLSLPDNSRMEDEDILPSEDFDDLLAEIEPRSAPEQRTTKKRPATTDEPPDNRVASKKTACLIDPSSANNNDTAHRKFVASQPKAILCRLKQGRVPDGTFRGIPCETADVETVLDELGRSYFAMIAGVKHEKAARWKFRPLVTSHTGGKLRPEDFEHFVASARRSYRISSADMFGVSDEMFARVFPDRARDHFEKAAVERTELWSPEQVGRLKAENGLKYRNLNVCGDTWSAAASNSAAQKLLGTGQQGRNAVLS